MTFPLHRDEFNQLPDSELLPCRAFCSTRTRLGPFPFSRSRWWDLVAAGQVPQGLHRPGAKGPTPTRYWYVGEIREAVRQLEAGEKIHVTRRAQSDAA